MTTPQGAPTVELRYILLANDIAEVRGSTIEEWKGNASVFRTVGP